MARGDDDIPAARLHSDSRRYTRPASRWAELGKLSVAASVFAVVFGGGVLVMQSRAAMRAASATLPGGGPASGCALWFIGSSTIHKWSTLATDMAPLDARNRGVDGATMPELLQMIRNEPRGTPPRAIVFYAGENDIAKGASAADDIANLRTFLKLKSARWGNLPVVIVSLKPTPTRWGNLPEQTAFNTAARAIALRTPGATFVNIVPLFLVNHRPGAFYVDDGIHLNAAGYGRLTSAIQPTLKTIIRHAPARACPQPSEAQS
ncbi:lysophospholipase L1-like esterase [Sphingomonas sp. PP-F2F-A104-K0414]|uniref:GDSL-type esterase/lipase family protein n=1 Tax=Sphingomonas sp. PP-F2F-A104-K0414 TaxID=2135661 RepID=UPI00104F0BE0|nr:GDSL-type esterase/lipase family protein [Sphingomonas sp. PP-F2F-A104-K0414]TCQ00073.1 lysophospholipase L1-like esterase [Sphingomonas sp. PP-F2F-A104-K0414]